jgi:hypothetical protein
MRARYARMTGRIARGKLRDEFVEVTGWERKHANKVLLGIKRRSQGRRGKRGSPTSYGAELLEALKTCWLAMEQPCGKRMTDICCRFERTIWTVRRRSAGSAGVGDLQRLTQVRPGG